MSYRVIEPDPSCSHHWSSSLQLLTPTAFGAFSRYFQRCLICAGVRDAEEKT